MDGGAGGACREMDVVAGAGRSNVSSSSGSRAAPATIHAGADNLGATPRPSTPEPSIQAAQRGHSWPPGRLSRSSQSPRPDSWQSSPFRPTDVLRSDARILLLCVDSVENLDVRPSKRSKSSELMDSELDKDVNASSPPSPSIQNMDPFNIKSDNVNNTEDRPLKRPKCSELRV